MLSGVSVASDQAVRVVVLPWKEKSSVSKVYSLVESGCTLMLPIPGTRRSNALWA